MWDLIHAEKIAVARHGGLTLVIQEWGDNPPPREGRPPSISEFLRENLSTNPIRITPEGVHRGRPRKDSPAEVVVAAFSDAVAGSEG
jgi:hypothetical protein